MQDSGTSKPPVARTPPWCLVALLLVPFQPVQGQAPTLERWLRDEGGFSNSDLRDLRAGTPVVRAIGPDDPSGLALLGAVRVATTPARMLALANRPVELLSDRPVLAAGDIHIPPQVGDFSSLTVPASDIQELRGCTPGSCRVKLPGRAMQDLVPAARSPGTEAVAGVTAHFRSMLFDYAERFVRDGLAALPPYVDKAEETSPLEALAPLRVLDQSFFAQSTALASHLDRFPESTASGITDRLVWTVEDVGLRPTIRLLHLALTQPGDSPAVDVAVAIQQLYASHYLVASITFLSLVIDTSVLGEPARFLVMLTRHRFDEEVDGMSRTALRRGTVDDETRRLLSLQQRLRP